MDLDFYDLSLSGLFGKKKKSNSVVSKTTSTKLLTSDSHSHPKIQVNGLHPFRDLKYPLLSFSESETWTLADAVRGVQVFGSIGSGKSSGSGKSLAYTFLKNGFGGIVLCVKPDERKNWEEYAEETGRYDDLIIFDKQSGIEFNPLIYELTRHGDGAGETINIVNLLMNVHQLGQRANGSEVKESNRFWENALRRLLSMAIDLLKLADEELSIKNMVNVITSAPSGKDYLAHIVELQAKAKAKGDVNMVQKWFESTYCTLCLAYASHNAETEEENHLLLSTQIYFLRELATLANDTRSGLLESFRGLTYPFESGILAKQFAKGVTIFPEITFNSPDEKGKIIILDFPVKDYLESGIYAQAIVKLLWQQAVERRKIERGEVAIPVFLWVDESQFFITEYDMMFQTTARSSRACTVFLTQNISNYYAVIGGSNARDRVNSLLGNLCTRIFHANNDFVTNQWAADAIGKTFRDMQGSNFGFQFAKGAMPSVSSSSSEQLHYQIEPKDFTTLKCGDEENDYIVEGYLTTVGKSWKDPNGNLLNYRKMEFSQE